MAHIGAEINTCRLAAAGIAGTAAADTDIVFLGRGNHDMPLHNNIAIFVEDGEVGGARRAGDDHGEAGGIQKDGHMAGIADDHGGRLAVKTDQFGLVGGKVQDRVGFGIKGLGRHGGGLRGDGRHQILRRLGGGLGACGHGETGTHEKDSRKKEELFCHLNTRIKTIGRKERNTPEDFDFKTLTSIAHLHLFVPFFLFEFA